ncbi:MAG TPA: DUF1801 domain-containing protein [Opitutaceae bacterium]
MAKHSKMAAAKPRLTGAASLDVFMAALEHPLKAEIRSVSALILGAAPGIEAAIKWNAPSFRTTEFFATTHLRSRDQVQLIFHLGAKVRAESVQGKVADPAGLLTWLAKDRAMVSLGTGKALAANEKALVDLVRAWIPFV